jgi:murein DD-endopeptidase MepM/ murein hydrolase activator NlpD
MKLQSSAGPAKPHTINQPPHDARRKATLQRLVGGLILLLTVFACSPQASQQATPTLLEPLPTLTQTVPPTVVEMDPTATAVLAAVVKPASSVTENQKQSFPGDLSDPLQFVFPTPMPAPVSAWRPPLYPIPWAPTPYDHFYFSRPIAADEVNWPLADYRYGGVFFQNVVHTGVDIPAARGTQVLAAGSGKVIWAGYGLYALTPDEDDPYGLAVAIRHDFGYDSGTLYSVYGHMDDIFVTKGQHLERGDLIGLVGDTGKVTGVHLHFEVRLGKNNFFGSRNPELWMSPPQGWGVLAGHLMSTGGALLQSHTIQVRSYANDQRWEVNSYGKGSTNSDPYYNENLVLGDLPAGDYEIWIPYAGSIYNQDIHIQPGMVSYFTFKGRNGFKVGLPPTPGTAFSPPASNSP